MALAFAPGREMVGAHGGVEARLFRALHIAEQGAGIDLFVGGVEADSGHGRPFVDSSFRRAPTGRKGVAERP